MSIVVTCACSRLGRGVAKALAARAGMGASAVLADAEPQRLDAALRAGAVVRHLDFHDRLSLPAALFGARTVLATGGGEGALDPTQLEGAVEAARAAGVERIVLVSSIDPRPGNPAAWAEADRAGEAMVRSSGLGWTVLRLQERLEDFVAIGLGQRPSGRMFTNRGAGLSAPIALPDAAAAIAAVLADPAHAGRSYDLTGPKLVATADLARALDIADIAHKDAKYLDQLLAEGVAPIQARAQVDLGRAVREGYYAVLAEDAAVLTGKPLLGLEDAVKAELRPPSA